MKMSRWCALALQAGVVMVALPGCMAVGTVAYGGAQMDAARACEAYPSMADREACLGKLRAVERADTDKQHQQAQTGDSQRAASEREQAARRQQGLCFKRQSTGETVCPN